VGSPDKVAGKKAKVLVVDDDQTMTQLLSTLLGMEGYQVATIQDWARVLDTVQHERPDIVIMDRFLPQSDGIELVKGIRSDPSTTSMKILMTSGMDTEELCLQAGADAFLLKPYSPDQLLEILQTYLSGTQRV